MLHNTMLMIHDFHARFGLAYTGGPRALTGEMLELRVKRLAEEGTEIMDATTLEELCDAVVDTLYIALGTAYLMGYANPLFLDDTQLESADWERELPSFVQLATMTHECPANDYGYLGMIVFYINRIKLHSGLPFEELFVDVHEANMRKERGTAHTSKYGNTYDIVKPEGWVGPNGAAILAKHGFNPKAPINLKEA